MSTATATAAYTGTFHGTADQLSRIRQQVARDHCRVECHDAGGPTGGQRDMTTSHGHRPAPRHQASQHLTAVADGLADRSVSIRLTHLGDTPVLTIEDSAAGQDPVTVSVDPDTSQPGLPLECTCIWTAAPGTSPEALAGTITAVLDAVRPFAAASHAGKETPSP